MEIIIENNEFCRIQCCICGIEFTSGINRNSNMCLKCLTEQQTIIKGVTREAVLNFCRHCKRYLGNTWQNMGRESKELLSLCLKKIKGIKDLKIVEAGFIWTEEHSRRVKVRLTVQKEIQMNVNVQDSFIVEFKEYYQQCLDCKKEFTPHQWVSSVQLRQRSGMKKTLLFLEQLILKLGAHEKCVNIKQSEDGLDFFFKNKSQGQHMIDFIQSQVPCRVKSSKQLISADLNNNTYNYKFVWAVELPKINRYDLIIIDDFMRKELGGASRYLICSKVTKFIYFIDNSGTNAKKILMDSEQYFNYEEKGHIQEFIPFRTNRSEFMVIDVDYQEYSQSTYNTSNKNDNNQNNTNHNKSLNKSKLQDMSSVSKSFMSLKKSAHIDVQRTSDWKQFSVRSHLGEILKTGHIVLGFDLTQLSILNDNDAINSNGNNQQTEVVLVMRQKNQNKTKRLYKLKRMEIEQENGQNEEEDNKNKVKKKKTSKQEQRKNNLQEQDMEELMQEIDRDPEMRKKINLYKNVEAIQRIKKERKEKYGSKQSLQEKIEELKKQQQLKKGREILKLKQKQQEGDKKLKKIEEEGSDNEWVDCNTDEENEQEGVKLSELLDDLKLSDGEQENILKEQQQLLVENEEAVDNFISQMANLKIHNQ